MIKMIAKSYCFGSMFQMKLFNAIIPLETNGDSMKTFKKTIDINEKANVLTKALLNVTVRLKITQKQLGGIIGLSEATTSRFFNNEKIISPGTKEGELSLYLIRIYRSLDAILGGNQENCQRWFKSYNKHLNGIPLDLVTKIEGLVNVANYLDVMRGKL